MNVEIKNLPEMNVAYIRNIGDYVGNENLFKKLFEQLMDWAGPKNLIDTDTTFFAAYYNDPETTTPEELKMDLCMTVPKGTTFENDSIVKNQVFSKGKFAIARFEFKDPSEYKTAWEELYQKWLPESGEQLDEKPFLEVYQNNPEEHPEGIQIVDLCISLK